MQSNITTTVFEEIQYCLYQEVCKAQRSITLIHSCFFDNAIYQLIANKAEQGVQVEIIFFSKAAPDFQKFSNFSKFQIKIQHYSHPSLQEWFLKYPLWIIDSHIIIVPVALHKEAQLQGWDFCTISSENVALSFYFLNELKKILQSTYFQKSSYSEVVDFSKIHKRLELLKNAILLEAEIEEIETHLERLFQMLPSAALEQFSEFNQLAHIYEKKMVSQELPYIIALIDSYQKQQKAIVPHANIETTIYDLQLKVLEMIINALELDKAELQKKFLDFHVQHNRELGDLNLKILEKRQQLKKAEAEKKRIFWESQQKELYLWDFEKAWEEYQNAKKEYEQYRYGYALSQQDIPQELDEEQQKQLKLLFRQASKLCHPDVVSPEYRSIAEMMFKELSYAYERNNLDKVKAIYLELQNQLALSQTQPWSAEVQFLKKELDKRSLYVEKLYIEIKEILYSETYRLIQVLDDWDAYFKQKKLQLQQILAELEKEHGKYEPQLNY
ncbi:MAG: hypothetical protein RML72_11340 [Bacteroidia bacterium]|nr:hypothetical protein [Bacteroidia bacterium]